MVFYVLWVFYLVGFCGMWLSCLLACSCVFVLCVLCACVSCVVCDVCGDGLFDDVAGDGLCPCWVVGCWNVLYIGGVVIVDIIGYFV